MIIPEFTLYRLLKMFLSVMREDFKGATTEQESFIYKLFNTDDYTQDVIALEDYNLFEQSKEVIISTDNQKSVKVKIGFSLDKLSPATISILMPSDSPSASEIGDGIGYEDSVIETYDDGDYNRAFKTSTNMSSYNLLITSVNMNEVVLIYHWLKAMFLVFREQLEFSGLKNCSFGGADVNFDAELVPAAIYHRNFNINFVYEYSVPELFINKIRPIVTNGTMEDPS